MMVSKKLAIGMKSCIITIWNSSEIWTSKNMTSARKGCIKTYKSLSTNRRNSGRNGREKLIAEREKLSAEVNAKVEAFPKELEANIKNGKDNGRNIGNYQAKIKSDLLTKDMEGQKQNYELQIQGMLQTMQNQDARIASLSKQLDSALKQVQDLAVKAIEGSSNLSSLQAVREIAIEQAKTQQKNK